MQDLEIYIRDLEGGVVSRWLGNHISQLALDDSDVSSIIKGSACFGEDRLKITLYPQAFGKRYTSLLIEGNRLPWNSDLECARSAWRALDTEVRCSSGEWKEDELPEDERWWRLDDRGEQLVVWN
ncbi:hypothetical protein [Marinobacter sp. ANT_B65]|uniref:hypothetical protein n=1 Tax=Marinobacter sp. ANT_B65 TaxID=2039467 RepID=UPI000BBECC71|nr:hypothetical protein [Marinobacter sp. ANT_B65]PCM43451.1 hypothetical protein CPA50_13775 [Marinobacter sp. ANT_B65]